MSILLMKTGAYQPLVDEYQYLSNLDTLNSDQEHRLAEILDLAVQDPILDEHILEIEMDMISSDDREEILNQQAKMREYIDVGIEVNSYPSTNIKFARLANDIVHVQL